MANLFSDMEGLRIGLDIEQRGQAYYRQAMLMAKAEEHRVLFQFLLEEETRHEELFRTMLDEIRPQYSEGASEYLFDPEVSRYLAIIAEMHVFPKVEAAKQKIAELKTTAQIMLAALQAEKDSVLFYDELAINAKFPAARAMFLKLKVEEQGHVVLLRDKMHELGLRD